MCKYINKYRYTYKKICIYIYIHSYIYICVCVCVCVYSNAVDVPLVRNWIRVNRVNPNPATTVHPLSTMSIPVIFV